MLTKECFAKQTVRLKLFVVIILKFQNFHAHFAFEDN